MPRTSLSALKHYLWDKKHLREVELINMWANNIFSQIFKSQDFFKTCHINFLKQSYTQSCSIYFMQVTLETNIFAPTTYIVVGCSCRKFLQFALAAYISVGRLCNMHSYRFLLQHILKSLLQHVFTQVLLQHSLNSLL